MAKAKPKQKMPVSERAKIFAPFAALKGLDEALAQKEKLKEPKRELSEDSSAELDYKLRSVTKGAVITVIYYDRLEERYVQLTGKVERLDCVHKLLDMTQTEIPFEDLYDIK